MAVSTMYRTGVMNVSSSHDLHIGCLLDGVRRGNEEVVTTLFRLYGISIDDASHYEAYFATPLIVAVDADQIGMVELILSMGADPNKSDYYNRSALYAAIEGRRDIAIIDKLLRAGADIYAPNEQGQTPMSLARLMGDKEVIRALTPYTKGHKRWRQIRIVATFFGAMIEQYHRSVHNVWRPDGRGYTMAKESFNLLAMSPTTRECQPIVFD